MPRVAYWSLSNIAKWIWLNFIQALLGLVNCRMWHQHAVNRTQHRALQIDCSHRHKIQCRKVSVEQQSKLGPNRFGWIFQLHFRKHLMDRLLVNIKAQDKTHRRALAHSKWRYPRVDVQRNKRKNGFQKRRLLSSKNTNTDAQSTTSCWLNASVD